MTTTQWIGPADDPDRYQLTEVRSRGGEGELWVGWIMVERQQLPVAVKVFHQPTQLPLDDLADRVRAQAEVLRSLEHPNLVKVREAFVGPAPHGQGAADHSTKVLYLVMNWVNGENLETWVQRNPDRDVLECARIVSRLAAAVDELHRGGSTQGVPVLHRDIKPANVIVDRDQVRLVDFGLARFASQGQSMIAGTPAYMAPELLAGGPPSEASDRFALGGVAYFLFTGLAPDLTDVPGMSSRLGDVSEIVDRDGFVAHVMAMLDPDPARRPTDVVGWADALAYGAVTRTFQRPGAPLPSGDAVPAPGTVATGSAGTRWGLAAGLLLLGTVVGGGAAYLVARDDDPEPPQTQQVADRGRDATTTESTTTVPETTTSLPTPLDGDLDPPESDTTEVTAPPSVQYLADVEPVDSEHYSYQTGQGDLSGETYTRSVMIDPDQEEQGYAEYNLSRAYSRVEGSVGLRDDAPSSTTMKVQMYADGEVIFDETVGLGDVVPFDLDVEGVLRLRVQITDLSEEFGYDVYAIVADPRLSQ